MNTTREIRPDPGPSSDGRERQMSPARRTDKYALGSAERKAGMDYAWWPVKIRGMPNPQFEDYWRAGWRPVRAGDHPEIAGLDVLQDIDQRFVDMGVVRQADKEGPVIVGDLALMLRPKQTSQSAQRELDRDATQLVENHLRKLRGESEAAIGAHRTTLSRRFEAPSDSETEIGR